MHRVKDLALPQELDLRLGRMHIDVHLILRQRDFQHAGREPADHDLIAIGLLQRRREHLRAHKAPVDKKVLIAARTARGRRPGNEAGNGDFLPVAVHLDHRACLVAAEQGINHRGKRPVAGCGKQLRAVLQKAKGNLRMRQRLLLHGGKRIGRLHRIAAHELHARGRIIKQIPNQDRRAVRAAAFLVLRHPPRL